MNSTRLARLAVSQLIGEGVRHVVLAPGSRSAPLAYALHDAVQAGLLRMDVRIDERDAGFLALGIGRGLRAAGEDSLAAVVTTSGTAVANLHPAVLEASYSRLPLLVLSADRPAELRGTGSNQTMRRQAGLFGEELRTSIDLPAPESSDALAGEAEWSLGLRTAIRTALAECGPVQVNAAFRDPLVPESADAWIPEIAPSPTQASRARGAADPWHAGAASEFTMDSGGPASLGPRPVVVIGETGGARPAEGALARAAELARRQGWPMLAEPSSGLRSHPQAVPAYRRVLTGDPDLVRRITGVLTIGRPTLSRPITRLLARTDLRHIVITPDPQWFGSGVPGALLSTPEHLPAVIDAPAAEHGWLEAWTTAGANACPAARESADAGLTMSAAAQVLTEQAGLLMAGSSSIIRDLDEVMTPDSPAEVHASRGLAGIDGLIATAAGLAIGSGRPVRAAIGDISALHDLGGLLLPALERRPEMELVVLNDDGGSIFAGLEHGRPEFAERFPRLFGTPHGLGFGPIAAALGWSYESAGTAARLRQILRGGVVPRRLVEARIG